MPARSYGAKLDTPNWKAVELPPSRGAIFDTSTRRQDRRQVIEGGRGDRRTGWPWNLATTANAARVSVIVTMFLAALIIDQGTGQRYSSVWGSAAIAASVVAIWPWSRLVFLEAAGFAATWIGFSLARAAAPLSGTPAVHEEFAGNLEATILGGHPPSTVLQDVFYEFGTFHAYDFATSATHLSFFVIPSLAAVMLRIIDRRRFIRYWIATGLCLVLATVGFVLVPTAPPWLHSDHATHRVLLDLAQAHGIPAGQANLEAGEHTSAFRFDPNVLAALPSVHVGAAVLVALATSSGSLKPKVVGFAYAAAMSISVVYLGEHYVIDVLSGWVVAIAGWMAAGRLAAFRRRVIPPRVASPARDRLDSSLEAQTGIMRFLR